MRYFKLSVVFLLLLFSATTFAHECKITILHFNDLHGHLATPKKGLGGAARLAGLVTKISLQNQKEGRETLVFMGGDLISGTPVSDKFKGEAEFKFLKTMGTEAMVLGNHEFDFGVEALKKNMKSTDIPIMSANVIDKKTKRHLGTATYVFPFAPNCRVGIMGLTSAGTPQTTGGDVSSLTFHDPIKYAGDYIDDLLEQSEIQIALTHIGLKKDMELARTVKGFDAIIGGHNHVRPEEYCRVTSGIPVCQTPSKGKYLGRVDLSVRNGKVVVEGTKLIPVDRKAGKSKHVKKMLVPYLSSLKTLMNEIVTTIDRTLYHRPRKGTTEQVPLGTAVADAMKNYVKADVAFMNTGGMRKTLKKGKVRRGDIFESLPFPNYVGVLNLRGTDLIKIVERSEKSVGSGHAGPYLNWAGLKYKKLNGRFKLFVNSKAVRRGKVYRVATVDFLAKGGDGYYMLKKKKFKNSGKFVRDVFERYIKSKNI